MFKDSCNHEDVPWEFIELKGRTEWWVCQCGEMIERVLDGLGG